MSPQGACRAHTALAPPSRAWLWIPPGGPKEFRLGVAHTFCPLIHPQRHPRRPHPPSLIDIPPAHVRPDNHPTSRANIIQLIPLCFFSVLSSRLPTTPSSHQMSLQSTLVKIALLSPQFARFHPSPPVAQCRFVSMGNGSSHNDVSQDITQPP